VPSRAFTDAILAEWRLRQGHAIWGDSPEVHTVYLGGGTPSRLEPGSVGRLLDGIARERPIAAGAEVTLEANPDDVRPESAAVWRAAGVNRVSLGVQSFDPAVLRWMHRTHTTDQVAPAVEVLRGAGIAEISLDLIFGLPAALGREWERDLDAAFGLAPEHLSLYGLTIEDHTPLAHWTARGEVAPVDEDRYAAEFLRASRALRAEGFDHYEVSNAGRPGHHARHNSAYWRRSPFIGLGPSAHSGLGRTRRWNLREWAAYERAVAAGADPNEGSEELSDASVAVEEVYLGLRTREGLPSDRLDPDTVRGWVASGWAELGQGRVRLIPEGWLRLDALVARVRA
jgi:oxygen-independent coproporphyrinogen-3 oxidase